MVVLDGELTVLSVKNKKQNNNKKEDTHMYIELDFAIFHFISDDCISV